MTIVELKGIDGTITEEDIKNDIELNVYSTYGGQLLHQIKISVLKNWLNTCERSISRDFIVRKPK